MTTYIGKFGTEFEQNKKTLDEVAIVRSKGLKNEIAGYITSYLRRQFEEQKEKESETLPQGESVDDSETIEEQILN
jgi:small subunit ribosomal protein S17e